MKALIVLLAVVLGLGYSAMLWQYQHARVWEWLHGLVATLLSVLLGVATAFWVYEAQQRSADKAETEKLRFLIQQELSELRRVLLRGEPAQVTVGTTEFRPLITFLQAPALELAAQSGHFSQVDTSNMLHMARKIKTYNVEVDFLVAALNVPGPDTARVDFAVRNMEQTRRAVLDDIELASRNMKIQLVDIP